MWLCPIPPLERDEEEVKEGIVYLLYQRNKKPKTLYNNLVKPLKQWSDH